MSQTKALSTLENVMESEQFENQVHQSLSTQSYAQLAFPEELEQRFVEHNAQKMRSSLQEHGLKLIAIYILLSVMLIATVPLQKLGHYPWVMAILFFGLVMRFIDSHIASIDPYTEFLSTSGGAAAVMLVMYGFTTVEEGYVKQIAMIGVALMVIAYYTFLNLRLKRAVTGWVAAGIAFVIYSTANSHDVNWALFSSFFIAPGFMGAGIAYISEFRERLVFLQELSLTLERNKLEELYKEVKRLSLIDPLTGLYNRRYLNEILQHEWARTGRNEQSIAIAFCDIDYFKQYNDFYGHDAGDHALKKISICLQQSANRAGDIVSRYGGEEFVLVYPETDNQQMQIILERIKTCVEVLAIPHQKSEVSTLLTLSMGIYVCTPTSNETYQDALIKADKALYEAKHKGRNRWCFYMS